MSDTSNAAATAPATTVAKKEQLAIHEYLDASGAVVEAIEQACGIRYTDKASGGVFTFQVPNAAVGTVATMFAIFGAKTRATNAASAARQKRKNDKTFVTPDVDYIDSVFAETKDGQWDVAGEGNRGPRYDLDVLAEVIHDIMVAKGAPDVKDVTVFKARLESDLAYRKGAMAVTEFRVAYEAKVGAIAKPAIDFNV